MGFGPTAGPTREDVIPLWMVEALPKGVVTTSVAAGRDEPPHRVHQSDKIEVVARRVCRACNNGWMSELEVAAKPYLQSMLRGHGRTYYEGGQAAMAAWAVKTVLMFDLVNPHPEMRRPIEDEHFQAMCASAPAVPPRMQVWLGAYRGAKTLWHWSKDIAVNVGKPDEAHAFTSTMLFGPIVLQVFGHLHPTPFDLRMNGDRADMGLKIAPFEAPVSWPPRQTMNEDNLWRFGQMFEKVGTLREIHVPRR